MTFGYPRGNWDHIFWDAWGRPADLVERLNVGHVAETRVPRDADPTEPKKSLVPIFMGLGWMRVRFPPSKPNFFLGRPDWAPADSVCFRALLHFGDHLLMLNTCLNFD